ncbi:MAG TPA: DUF192 domain-containing protein [Candidatus Paceibacterota bacterium]|nr:DUF192 domain-containing protein [Candidatus Paceibacterota bacterium]
MNIRLLILVIAVIIVIGLVMSMSRGSVEYTSTIKPEGTLRISGTAITFEIADTDEERIRGLSGRPSLRTGHGLLFIFPEEGNHGIWMKDMKFPIDIIWADREGIIVTIARNVSPDTYPQSFYPSKPARYVLELPAGTVDERGILEGMTLQRE